MIIIIIIIIIVIPTYCYEMRRTSVNKPHTKRVASGPLSAHNLHLRLSSLAGSHAASQHRLPATTRVCWCLAGCTLVARARKQGQGGLTLGTDLAANQTQTPSQLNLTYKPNLAAGRRLALVLKMFLLLPLPLPAPWSITQTRATYGGLCGMPACGQAVGCDVCDDTPELWRDAAGLCARVYARVLVPPNLYIHTQALACRRRDTTSTHLTSRGLLSVGSRQTLRHTDDQYTGTGVTSLQEC